MSSVSVVDDKYDVTVALSFKENLLKTHLGPTIENRMDEVEKYTGQFL